MSAAPFDCTVDAVYALAPETERLTDGATSRMPTPITEATVAGWITEVGAQGRRRPPPAGNDQPEPPTSTPSRPPAGRWWRAAPRPTTWRQPATRRRPGST